MNLDIRLHIWSALLLAITTPMAALAANPPAPAKNRIRPLTRLIWEDHSNQSLRWLDVQIDDQKKLSATTAAAVAGIKTLNAEKQKLVQLRECQGLVVAGVRDDEDGQFESGWVLVDSGVRYRDHGDHGHWSFRNPPSLAGSVLDKNQGNPAHVYLYDGRFFIANDQKGGYTRIDPTEWLEPEKRPAALGKVRFIEGGGNHITLAVADDKVGYSAWIDGGGPKKGQVDVTLIHGADSPKPAYSFHLPTGGIHGAAVAAGKVFLAPSDGLCWTEVDTTASRKAEDVQVRHISLGKQDDMPRRTGSFATHGRHLVFTTGKNTGTQLAILDAGAAEPRPMFLDLKLKEGAMAVSPVITKTTKGRILAFVFHDHASDVELEDQLSIVDLDPNRDGSFGDAAIVRTLAVGPSAVEGHYGHHAICFDAESQYAFFSNPGSGKVTALRLADFAVAGDFHVGGKPTAIEAVGGREVAD
jgi:hypothetical protein